MCEDGHEMIGATCGKTALILTETKRERKREKERERKREREREREGGRERENYPLIFCGVYLKLPL